MTLRTRRSYERKRPRKRSVREILRRHRTKRCQRCGRKIKAGHYCYHCGKYKGLW